MGRGWRPLLVGAAVTLASFGLAEATVFAPAGAPGSDGVASGDAARGENVFQRECAGCHGVGGRGGVGPSLADASLDTDEIAAAVDQGRGIMPAGLVEGQERADVVAYVVSLSSP